MREENDVRGNILNEKIRKDMKTKQRKGNVTRLEICERQIKSKESNR